MAMFCGNLQVQSLFQSKPDGRGGRCVHAPTDAQLKSEGWSSDQISKYHSKYMPSMDNITVFAVGRALRDIEEQINLHDLKNFNVQRIAEDDNFDTIATQLPILLQYVKNSIVICTNSMFHNHIATILQDSDIRGLMLYGGTVDYMFQSAQTMKTIVVGLIDPREFSNAWKVLIKPSSYALFAKSKSEDVETIGGYVYPGQSSEPTQVWWLYGFLTNRIGWKATEIAKAYGVSIIAPSTVNFTDKPTYVSKAEITSSDNFYVTLKMLEGSQMSIDIDEYATVENLKLKISTKTLVAPYEMRLIFAGKQLEDGVSLKDYGIGCGAIIHLTQRLSTAKKSCQ